MDLSVIWSAMIFMWRHSNALATKVLASKIDWKDGLHACKSWWRHQMETFSALLAICAGESPIPVNSPHKGQWRGALMFSLICACIGSWVNNRKAGDLKRHRAHYDVSVMSYCFCTVWIGKFTPLHMTINIFVSEQNVYILSLLP